MPHCSGSQTCFCPSVPEGGTWFVGDSTLQSLLALWGQSHDWFSFTFCIQMPNPEPGNSQAHSRSSVRGCWGELAGLFVIHHCILTTEQNPGPEFNTGQISEWISNVKKKLGKNPYDREQTPFRHDLCKRSYAGLPWKRGMQLLSPTN